MTWCEMCEVDFFTATEATTTRVRERDGVVIHMCETCARIEWDGGKPVPSSKKEKDRPVKTKKGKKGAGSRRAGG